MQLVFLSIAIVLLFGWDVIIATNEENFGNYLLNSGNDYFEYELEKWHSHWSDKWCGVVKWKELSSSTKTGGQLVVT